MLGVGDFKQTGVAEPRQNAIALDQLRLALVNLLPNAVLAPILGAVICWIFSRWIPVSMLASWLTLVTLGGVPLALVAHRFLRNSPKPDDAKQWVRRATVAHATFAAAWASMGYFLWIHGNDFNHLLILLILACSLAANMALIGANHSLSISGYAIHGLTFIVLPLREGGATYDGLSLLAFLYVCYLMTMSLQLFRTARRMVHLAHEKTELVEEKNGLIAALSHSKEEAERARVRSEDANRAKSEFLANMSHELRTPLNAILGFSEMLQDKTFAPKTEEYAEVIHRSGAHLLGLINDILDLSKIEAGKFELTENPVNICDMIAECISVMSPKALAGNLTLAANVTDRLPDILADERALKQILLNLVSNAVKFTPPWGRVEVFAALTDDGDLAFGVQDTGIGIAEDDQERVFESFGQGRHDVVTADKGTGLGLPIVKGLVREHGGRIALTSRIGEGTRVTVYLPAIRVLKNTRAA